MEMEFLWGQGNKQRLPRSFTDWEEPSPHFQRDPEGLQPLCSGGVKPGEERESSEPLPGSGKGSEKVGEGISHGQGVTVMP